MGFVLEPKNILIPKHGVGLPGARRPVSEYRCVFARHYRLDQLLHCLLIDLLRRFVSIYLVERVTLFFRAVQHIQLFAVLTLELGLHWVQDNLNEISGTMRLSWALMMSDSLWLSSLWLRGRTRMATRMLESPSCFLSFSFSFI